MGLAAMQDVHIIASLLKLYFRELPDPAIQFMFYDEIMSIMHMQGIFHTPLGYCC